MAVADRPITPGRVMKLAASKQSFNGTTNDAIIG
jgi:hypothetical protein